MSLARRNATRNPPERGFHEGGSDPAAFLGNGDEQERTRGPV
jgi:hypothetical protein